MNKSKISIVVPTLGSKENLQKLLNSVAVQDLALDAVDVVVVVNGMSLDSFTNLKKELSFIIESKITWMHLLEANVNAARNRGLESVTSNVVYFLDDDCELINKSTLSFHLSSHSKDSDLFAIGGGYNLPPAATYWDELYNSIQMSWLLSGKQGASSNALHLIGGNFSVKKDLLKTEKLKFDERISYGGSEHQLFVEAVQKKLKIQICNIDVRHNTKETFRKICYKIFRQGRGKAIIDENVLYDKKNKNLNSISFMSSSEESFEISKLKDSLLRKVLNYVFWFGYYKYNKTPFSLLKKIIQDLFNYLNYLRYKIIDKFK